MNRAGLVSGTNFVFCSHWNFEPARRAEISARLLFSSVTEMKKAGTGYAGVFIWKNF